MVRSILKIDGSNRLSLIQTIIQKRKKNMKINCENCGKEFDRKPSQIKLAKHHTCSTKCQHELRGKLAGKTTKCKFCKKPLKKSSEENTFCNNVCKDNHEKYTNTKTTNGFMENKYTKLYFKIVENRKNNPLDGYTENHHILPDSMGGSIDKSNMIRLSAREHFICHFLLTKMTVPYSIDWVKMQKAFTMMDATSEDQKRYFNSKLYESQRKNFSKAQSINQTGKKNSQYGKCWITKEEVNKKINKEELDVFIEKGWIKGRYVLKRKQECYRHVCCYCAKEVNDGNYWNPKKKFFCSSECKRYNKRAYLKDIDDNYELMREIFINTSSFTLPLQEIIKWYDSKDKRGYDYFVNKLKSEDILQNKINEVLNVVKDDKGIALYYYELFKNGEYNSIYEFCEKESDISAVTMAKKWKKYVNGFSVRQGVRVSSKDCR